MMKCYPLDNTDYDASDLGAYLCTRTRGVYCAGDNLAVIANDSMSVTVHPGLAWLKWSEYWGVAALQPDQIILDLEPASGNLDRIDAVVCRLNKVQNKAEIVIKKGSLSSAPILATPERNDNYDEIYLATIRVAAGAVAITQAAITDQRASETYCGLMRDAVTGIPTEQLQAQADALIADLEAAIETAKNKGFVPMTDTITDTEIDSLFAGEIPDSGGDV